MKGTGEREERKGKCLRHENGKESKIAGGVEYRWIKHGCFSVAIFYHSVKGNWERGKK
jgi:hypothetical protein